MIGELKVEEKYFISSEDTRFGFLVTLKRPENHYIHYSIEKRDETIVTGDNMQLVAEGSLKWSGCSDTTFKGSSHHYCGVDGFILLNRAFQLVWTRSKELIDEVDEGPSELSCWDDHSPITIKITKETL
jgi:hypothetical protein